MPPCPRLLLFTCPFYYHIVAQMFTHSLPCLRYSMEVGRKGSESAEIMLRNLRTAPRSHQTVSLSTLILFNLNFMNSEFVFFYLSNKKQKIVMALFQLPYL